MIALGIVAWLAFVAGIMVGLSLAKDAPVCRCGDLDCGSECLDWSRWR